MKSFLKYWLPVPIWLGFIFIGSTDLMSAEHTSRFLISFLLWLRSDMSPETVAQINFVMRKMAHVTEYAILAILFWRAMRHGTSRQLRMSILFVIVWILCAIFAATDEFHQSFVPSRGASVGDVGIDSIGAIAGLLIAAAWSRHRSMKR